MPRNPLRPSDVAFGALGFLLALLVRSARAVCARCKAKATEDQRQEAEAARVARSQEVQSAHDEALARNQRGEFTVYRCKLCGLQHHPQSGPGVPFCWASDHVAGLEAVHVVGPPHAEDLSHG